MDSISLWEANKKAEDTWTCHGWYVMSGDQTPPRSSYGWSELEREREREREWEWECVLIKNKNILVLVSCVFILLIWKYEPMGMSQIVKMTSFFSKIEIKTLD